MSLPRRLFAALGATAVLLSLTACSQTLSMKPAPHADASLCADMMTNLPASIAEQERMWTDAQSTAAWGAPSITMICGVEEPAASTLPCTSVSGIDWLVDESDPTWYTVTSFGRSPAVQVHINQEQYVDPAEVLQRIGKAMTTFPLTAECTVKTTH